jgi:UDP-N-acetylglucosamine acyltransferase
MPKPNIHPTAIVSPRAQIGDDVEIGPYSFVGEHAAIGRGTRIGMHAVIEGYTSIGERCRIFTGAVIGSPPQDFKYRGEVSYLRIGNDNIIREYVTINPGTQGGGGQTTIGHENLIMAYVHVAHDCLIGDKAILANGATLAGHVHVGDQAIIGGLVAVHQFTRIGRMSIIGGCSKVVQDVPPYSTCDGHPALFRGLNIIGLERAGIATEAIRALRQTYRCLYRVGLSRDHALQRISQEIPPLSQVQEVVQFVRTSDRGICRGTRARESTVLDSAEI